MGQGKLTANDHSKEWPEALRKAATTASHDTESWQPILIEMGSKKSETALNELVEKHRVRQIIDNYDEQYAELVVSRHPQLYQSSLEVKRESLKEYLADHFAGKKPWQMGAWVYYPWTGNLIHILEKELFIESRTIRNNDLITADEQQKYGDFAVGCAGMSVGSNVALSLGISGGSQKIKLADGAVISASNLNRIMTGVYDVGNSKSLVIARKLAEMNPFMEVARFGNIDETNVDDFFMRPWPINVVVDEIDDLKTKILLRVEARKRRIPVVMVTDTGDDAMLDVERFDLDGSLPLFHCVVPGVEELLTKKVSKPELLKYATSIIGPQNTSLRLQQSLLKIGTKLVTQPQIGPSAMMSGVVAAYAIRQIALGEKLKSGRTIISLDKHLRTDLVTFKHRAAHKKHTKRLKRALDSM
jgi:molybdopterin/thiamine biosynthesis adenylyltransferase